MRGGRLALAVVGLALLPRAVFAIAPRFHRGNARAYAPLPPRPGSPLRGRKVYALGSSVTLGSAALGRSFVDDLAATHGVRATKEAVGGTTLADVSRRSYVRRFAKLPDERPDALIVQLSTNDASQAGIDLGTPDSRDPATSLGALRTIVDRARGRWGDALPILVYTGSRFSPGHRARGRYERLVAGLLTLARRERLAVLDLYHASLVLPGAEAVPLASFPGEVDDASRRLFMADDVHPTRAGYRDWWTPAFAEALTALLIEERP